MSWAKMIRDGLRTNIYGIEELQTFVSMGLDQLLTENLITSDEKTELTSLVNAKIAELQG